MILHVVIWLMIHHLPCDLWSFTLSFGLWFIIFHVIYDPSRCHLAYDSSSSIWFMILHLVTWFMIHHIPRDLWSTWFMIHLLPRDLWSFILSLGYDSPSSTWFMILHLVTWFIIHHLPRDLWSFILLLSLLFTILPSCLWSFILSLGLLLTIFHMISDPLTCHLPRHLLATFFVIHYLYIHVIYDMLSN